MNDKYFLVQAKHEEYVKKTDVMFSLFHSVENLTMSQIQEILSPDRIKHLTIDFDVPAESEVQNDGDK